MSAICDSVLFVSLTFSVSLSLYILVVVQIKHEVFIYDGHLQIHYSKKLQRQNLL